MMRLIKYVESKEILSFLTRDINLFSLESPFCLLFVCHLFETVSMLPIHNLHMILSCKIRDMIFAEASVGSLLMKTVCYLLVKFS